MMMILSCHPCAWPALCTWHWHFCASCRTESRWEPWWLLDSLGFLVYLSLSSRAGAEIAWLCRASLRPVWALLGSLLNTTAAAPLLYTHPPTQRDRAFPRPSHFLTRGRGYRCSQFARWKAIGAPAMITRMLQPPSPSRGLFPEFLKAEPSRQSRHGTESPFCVHRRNRTTRHAVKRPCWLPRQTPDSHLIEPLSSNNFLCTFCTFEHEPTCFEY